MGRDRPEWGEIDRNWMGIVGNQLGLFALSAIPPLPFAHMGSNHKKHNHQPAPAPKTPAKYPRCDPTRYRITEYNRDTTRCHALLTPDQERAYASAAAAGDTSARDRLIYSQLPLVISIARKFLTNPVDFEDLIQEGNLALIAAVDRLDPARARLSTFATLLITQRIRRYVVANATVIRRPASHRLSGKSRCRHEAAGYCLSLNMDDIGPLASDLVEDRETSDPDSALLMLTLSRAIDQLPPKDRDIVLYRLRGETLQEVGRRYDVTRERVRQIEAIAVERLREILRGSGFASEIPDPAGGVGAGQVDGESSTPQGWRQGELGLDFDNPTGDIST